MIQKNIVKQPKSIVEVQVAVPWADMQAKWDEVLQKMSQDVEISGFRKGMAPVNIVEQQLGTKLQDEVLKVVMPQFLIEALKGSDIIPIDYPKYEVVSFVKGQGLQYRAIVTNRPQVTVGDYKQIKISKPPVKPATDEEVNKVVDDLFAKWKARQPVATSVTTPPASTGQPATISFQGGQTAATPAAPVVTDTPNDDFAKAMGATSMTDLKDKVRKDLDSNITLNGELDFEEAILQKIADVTQVEIPEVLVQDELNRMLVSLQRRVADMGLLLEDYLKSQKKTLEQLKDEWRPQAEKNVKMELGLAEVARSEGVTISDSDLQAEIDKIQDARIKQQFQFEEPKLQLKHQMRQIRTLDLLKKLVAAS